MKSILLACAGIFIVNMVMAQNLQPSCIWSNLFDGATAAGDQATNNVVCPDGSIYWQLTAGSTSSARDIDYAGKFLFEGGDYDASGTSYNNNLVIMKTDRNGNLLWNLHSVTNDFAGNEGGVAPMPDGGVVFAARLRCSDLGGGICQWESLILIDGTGKTITVPWKKNPEDTRRFYKGIVGRLDKEGNIIWIKNIETSRQPVSNSGNSADFLAEALKITSVATDEEGNIFVGGNYRSELTIEGSDIKLTPHNIKNWNGDSQGNVGDMYIIRFDSDGIVTKTLTTTGDVDMESVQSLIVESDILYALLDIRGAGSLRMGNKQFETEGIFNPIIIKMTEDFEPVWITVLTGETVQSKYGFQNSNISVYGSNVWVTSQINGKVSYSDTQFVETFNGSTREGMIIGLNDIDGSWKAGALSRSGGYNAGLTGYLNSFQAPGEDNKVYVYGYVMNASQGVFIRTYNAVDLSSEPETEWKLITGGGVPTAQAFSYDSKEGEVFVTARGNKSFKVIGGEETTAPTSWGVIMAGFSLPENFRTGVESTESIQQSPLLEIFPMKGGIAVDCSKEGEYLKIYNFAGQPIAQRMLTEGRNVIELPAGFYITGGKKFVVN